MEFLDEDARPRFVLQSKTPDHTSAGGGTLSKPILAVTVTISAFLIVFSLFFVHSEPSKSLLLWLSLSLLLGPLAPPSLTAGDFRVGRGPALSAAAAADTPAPPPEKKPRRRPDNPAPHPPPASTRSRSVPSEKKEKEKEKDEVWEEREWTEDEIEVLKKQLAKNPAGKPGRWDSIAETFRGRHGVEGVIRKAKELGEKKSGDADSYSEFLRRRKPVDNRFLAEQAMASNGQSNDLESSSWSSGEDIALLNALKVFPKEAAMRWEKVAAAVPGKSKAACVKRVAELKKGFRESKKMAEMEGQEE